MVGQPGIASASAASAVTQRYRDAATIQVQRTSAKPQDFAAALRAEPSVITVVAGASPAVAAPARPLPEAALSARPVSRTVLPSPALARRGSAAYEAASSIDRPGAESQAEIYDSYSGSLNVEC